jgi:hypothetical protein
LFASALFLALAGSATQAAVAANPGCALGTQAVHFALPDTAKNFRTGWHLKVSIAGGKERSVQIDTGSIGFVVGRNAVGPHAVGPLGAGRQEYTSNGLILLGHYYRAPVTFEAGTARATTAPVTLLAVEQLACDQKYSKCSVRGRSAQSVGVLGVGFARKESIGSNAFLQIAAMQNGGMHAGYIVAEDAITLGLTPQNSRGFQFISLTRGPHDWLGAPACFGFRGKPGYAHMCGTILVDTGLASMIVSRAESLRPPDIKTAIPDGTPIEIAAPAFERPIMHYRFSVGDRGPLSPTSIRWSSAAGNGAFVNTGRNVIRGYDYLYDAKCGRVGFRARN